MDDYKELLLNNQIITAEVLKRKFLGFDENSKTFLELIDYHNDNMQKLLSPAHSKVTTPRAVMWVSLSGNIKNPRLYIYLN